MDYTFYDSYGNKVTHGCTILIEHSYKDPCFNNKKAFVEWLPKQGMFAFRFKFLGRGAATDNFFTVHKFKVLVNEKLCNHACSPSDYYKGGKCDKMGCYES